jgi:hypothetical protein
MPREYGSTIGRPPKEPPHDAALRIRELASEGHSLLGIANMLGTSPDTLRRWMKEQPELREQYDLGRERERLTLTNILYQKALAGDAISAMFLLKARHGYKEGEQPADAGRVNVTIQLPAALPMSSLPVIEHGNPIPQPIALPTTRDADT